MKKIMMGAAVVAATCAFGVGTANAAGGNGASVCSGSSAPDGIVNPGDFGTWNSPGEVIGFVASNGLKLPGGIGTAVADICNPT